MRLCLLDEEERDNVIKKADEKEKRKLEKNYIPGKLERFIDAFENLEERYNTSDSRAAKREAEDCLGLIQRLKSQGITKENFMVAVAGNFIPTEVAEKIKTAWVLENHQERWGVRSIPPVPIKHDLEKWTLANSKQLEGTIVGNWLTGWQAASQEEQVTGPGGHQHKF
ncbi:hypothetical protein Ndes2437B_g06182 [Nannochloris sp. 'desiccata']